MASIIANTYSIIFSKYKALVVDVPCIICSGVLTFQFVIVKRNITFIEGKIERPLERSKKVGLVMRHNIYGILTTHQASYLILTRARRDGH